MCYAAIALVTDMDAGVETGSGVGQEEVFAMFAAQPRAAQAASWPTAVGDLPDPDGCSCSTWADGIDLTYEVP